MNAKQIAVPSPYKPTIKFNECVAIKSLCIVSGGWIRNSSAELVGNRWSNFSIYYLRRFNDEWSIQKTVLINLDFRILSRIWINALAYL